MLPVQISHSDALFMQEGEIRIIRSGFGQKQKATMTIRKPLLSIMLMISLLCLPRVCSAQSLNNYLHKNARLGPNPPSELFRHSARKPISPQQAALFAVRHLKARGVTDIRICEAHWIAAAISGYLVDAKGKATIDEMNYATFRIGIRDGLEEKGGQRPAGEMFVFIALGRDESGRSVWYPSPGPDYRPAEGEATTEGMLVYEFLLYREKFETLATRYP